MKFYQHYMASSNGGNIDSDLLPIGNLLRESLLEAKSILEEISVLLEEKVAEKKKYLQANGDVKRWLEIENEIAERSSRFYELIPSSRFRD